MPTRLTALLLVAVAGAAGVLALWPREPQLGAAEAAAVAVGWVGTGSHQQPRRDEDEWEVDVVRPDGSLVEVTVGNGRELIGIDEERGAGGGPAPDELRGPRRAWAVRVALAASGAGRVLDVERESEGDIEVGVRRPDGTQVEVGLDRQLRILEVEREDLADE